jgi:hypothetical protein
MTLHRHQNAKALQIIDLQGFLLFRCAEASDA